MYLSFIFCKLSIKTVLLIKLESELESEVTRHKIKNKPNHK